MASVFILALTDYSTTPAKRGSRQRRNTLDNFAGQSKSLRDEVLKLAEECGDDVEHTLQ